jgi:hypothetical protein
VIKHICELREDMEFLYYMNIGSNEKSGASISVEPVVSILA